MCVLPYTYFVIAHSNRLVKVILMSIHIIRFYEELTKIYFNNYQISSNTHLTSSPELVSIACTAAFTYYYDTAILQNNLTPLSIFRDLALRKRDSKKFMFYFYVFYRVNTNIQK